MFARLGRIVTAHPWRVIALWVLAVALVVPFSPTLAEVSSSDQQSFLPADKESVRADALAQTAFPTAAGTSALLVVSRDDGEPLTADDQQRVAALADELGQSGIDRVTAVATGAEQVAPNGRVQLVQIAFEGDAWDEAVKDAVPQVRERVEAALAGSGLEAPMTGEAAMALDTEEAFGSAEAITFAATLALILILVGVIFRSPVAAFMPILTIGLVFTLATSLVALCADVIGFQVDQSLTSLLIVVLFGIGTDYILFLLFRYRERLRAGDEGRAAVAFGVRRVGEAVASSALVVMIAFTALLLSELESFGAMAPGLVISVGVMLLASLTLIPAVMALVGPRIFWPSKRWQTAPESTTFKRIGQLIARRPGRVAAASGGLLVVLAAGLAFYTASYDTSSSLPDSTESSQGYDQMVTALPPGALSPTDVFVRDADGVDADRLAALRTELAALEGVAAVAEPALSPDGTAARLSVTLADRAESTEALDLVAGELRDVAHASGAGDEVLVGGTTSALADVRGAVNRDAVVVFPVAAALIALVLALLLRSLVAPVYLLAAVALGFAATLGAGVAIFQGAAGQDGLLFMLPIMLYLFVVAIGTDYNILMTARLREEVSEGSDPRTAADLAVEHAGPTVAAAGVILAGTFASLGLTGISLLVQMGVTIAIGVLIVSMVMAIVFVPSVSALLGRRIWWPGHRGAREPVAPAAEGAAAEALASEEAYPVGSASRP